MEVTIALGVAAFCLVALLGLLPIGLSTQQRSISQAAAVNILSVVYADIRATPTSSSTSPQFGINVPSNASSGSSTKTLFFDAAGGLTASTANQVYRCTVNFAPNPAGAFGATSFNLKVTWPGSVDPAIATPAGSIETIAAVDRQ